MSGRDESCPLCGADLSKPGVCPDFKGCMDRRVAPLVPAVDIPPVVAEPLVHDCLDLKCTAEGGHHLVTPAGVRVYTDEHALRHGTKTLDEVWCGDPPGGEA